MVPLIPEIDLISAKMFILCGSTLKMNDTKNVFDNQLFIERQDEPLWVNFKVTAI